MAGNGPMRPAASAPARRAVRGRLHVFRVRLHRLCETLRRRYWGCLCSGRQDDARPNPRCGGRQSKEQALQYVSPIQNFHRTSPFSEIANAAANRVEAASTVEWQGRLDPMPSFSGVPPGPERPSLGEQSSEEMLLGQPPPCRAASARVADAAHRPAGPSTGSFRNGSSGTVPGR